MIVNGWQDGALIVIPERLRVGDDALVDDRAPVARRVEPSGRHPHVLIVLEAVEVGA